MKNGLSIAARVYNLIFSAPPTPPLTEEEAAAENKAISIRFTPDVRKFIEHQAANLNCSCQDIVSITMTAIMRATDTPQSSQLELMCARFRYLFESYNVATADIPRLLGSTPIRRSDLMHNESLVDALTDDVIANISNLFNISSDWLKGTSDNVIPSCGHGSWYKNINNVAFRIACAAYEGYHVSVVFVSQFSADGSAAEMFARAEDGNDDNENRLPIGVVLQLARESNGKRIQTYQVLGYERWNYSRCRSHLKYLALFCKRTRVNAIGISLSKENFFNLFGAKALPLAAIQSKPSEQWQPEIWNIDNVLDSYSTEDEIGTRYLKLMEMAVLHPNKIKDISLFKRGEYEQALGIELKDSEQSSPT